MQNILESVPANDKGLRILEAARVLFSKSGLRNTSIEDIASSAGLGKGTVYLYFKSKEEIFENLASRFAGELHAALDDAHKTPASAREKLLAHIGTLVRFWERSYEEYGLTVSALLEALSSPISEAIRKRYEVGDIGYIQNLLEEGVAAREFEVSDTRFSAVAIHSMFDALIRPWELNERKLSSEEKIQSFSGLLLHGVKARV